GKPLNIPCKAFFGFSGESGPMIYWMKGEKFIEELAGHIREGEIRQFIKQTCTCTPNLKLKLKIIYLLENYDFINTILIFNSRKHKSPRFFRNLIYKIELAGGLGAIFLLLVLLVVIYKCYNIELMLFYRQHFGADETNDDNKEYDAYLSYTKVDQDALDCDNPEEEQFALEVLDLIPSGTYMEDLTRYVEQSRRLIIVLTPDYILRRGWSIFELESRLHNMLVSGEIKVILIECTGLKGKVNCQEVESLKRSIKLLSLIKWKGPKSSKLNSKFWKHLVYEMPIKKKEMLSQCHVLDSAEQGLFGELQPMPSIAMTTTSATLVSSQAGLPEFHHSDSMQMRHCCRGYKHEIPTTTLPVPSLGNHHTYCNLPLTLLNGQLPLNNTLKDTQEFHRNSSLLPLSSKELSFTSDIW
uniref:Interleukin 1 receptor accessory protein like 2 n=1 Tax=Rhinopithecus bieti TaxID=61621 RepID=A0A2K6MD29_RHIBE